MSHLGAYRRLTILYPGSFRREYRDDLVALFAAQLGDEPAARVWLRNFRDLAVSVPARHLEAHMQSPSPRIVPLVAGVAAGAAALMALVGGTGPGTPALVVAAAALAAIAYWSWRDSRPVEPPGRLWLRLLVAGPVVAGLTTLGSLVPWPEAVDLGDNAYWLLVFAFATSIVLFALGVLLGIATAVERRRHA